MISKTNQWKSAVAVVLIASRFGLPMTSTAQENKTPLRDATNSIEYKIKEAKKCREEVKQELMKEIQKIEQITDRPGPGKDSLVAIGEELGYRKDEIDPGFRRREYEFLLAIGMTIGALFSFMCWVRLNNWARLNKIGQSTALQRNQPWEKFARFFKGAPSTEEIVLADKLCAALFEAGCDPRDMHARTRLFGKGQRITRTLFYTASYLKEVHETPPLSEDFISYEKKARLKADIDLSDDSCPFRLRCGGQFYVNEIQYEKKAYFGKNEFDKFKEAVVKIAPLY